MNEVMNAILTRRSIRKFTADPIPAEVLEDLVKAALHAPSGMGKQTWQFTVVTNHEIIHRLCGLIGTELGREGYDMYGPAAIVIVAHEKGAPFGREDDGCAMQSMMLAAHSLGLGSVWINQLQGICDEPAVRAELDALGVPATSEVGARAAATKPGACRARTPFLPKNARFGNRKARFGACLPRVAAIIPGRRFSPLDRNCQTARFLTCRDENACKGSRICTSSSKSTASSSRPWRA